MARPKVLIVDDDPDILLMLRINFETSGFSAVLAADGETALRRIEDERPDVVILDAMMPVLDGWGVLERLAGRTHRPPVIMLSARVLPADQARAYRLGASDHLSKPFDFDRLVASVRGVLGRSEAERDERRRQALARLGHQSA